MIKKNRNSDNSIQAGKHIELSLSDKLSFHENVQVKLKKKGLKKPSKEEKIGDNYSRDDHGYKKIHRIIDRENNRYYEEVTNPDTGEVIHKEEEALSDHKGHGSDKFKKSPKIVK